ncbi:MAG: DUF6263 family protein [Planctomycetota bacterium]|jgi:predicted Zn-dependent protease
MANRRRFAVLILSVATICVSAPGADAIDLRFGPEIGEKQTMRMTSRVVTNFPSTSGQDKSEFVWIFDVEIEPLAIAADGSVTLRAGILRVREESSLAGIGEICHFDSAEGGHELSHSAGKFVAFLGESFTVVTSARGRILELNTDDFYARIAENRIVHEDHALRIRATAEGGRRYRDYDAETRRSQILADGDKAIQENNEHFGSREKRKQAYIEEAAESNYYGKVSLRILFQNLLVPFAPEPVQSGDSWEGSVMLRIEGPMELTGTYTLEGVANGVSTIWVEARRNSVDKPIGMPPVDESQRIKLVGGYRAEVKVEQATGSVLSAEAVMDLTGIVPVPSADASELGQAVPVTTRATVTVEKQVSTEEREVKENSLEELIAQADKVLEEINVSARADIDVVLELVDRLIEADQFEDAEIYVTRALELYPWNLKYQMIYGELLAKSGKREEAREKATLVLRHSETDELSERARKLLHEDSLPEFEKISVLPGTNHCIVLVPLQGCDKWLIVRIKEELSIRLGIPVYIQTTDPRVRFPGFSRDRRSLTIDKMRQRLIEKIDHPDTVEAIKELNLSREDLDDEDKFLKLAKYLLESVDARAAEELEALLEYSRGMDPQWDADQLREVLLRAIMPYRRMNVAYLGVTSVDIYARDYNFLFGWAGRLCGVMSYHRFTADFNDDIPDQERLVKRSVMQSLSAVGLIYGLKRCTDPTCARAYPHSLAEHDAKKGTLCPECKNKFRKKFGQPNTPRSDTVPLVRLLQAGDMRRITA